MLQPVKMKQTLSLVCLAVGLISSSSVYSLGVGGANARSYIGQPLWVQIPLYNVESPNNLKIELERLGGDDTSDLTAELSRANSQLSILIRSDVVVNEPYFNFSLNLTDQGNEFRKQFTVLLNLSPNDARRNAQLVGSSYEQPDSVPLASTPSVESSITAYDVTPSASVDRVSGSIMGPYDWAESGAIPEKFGAVLDGQSLWRVARRISPAMNVTNNQMMWALYQANPHAFASKNIESLRAGTYLSIPDASDVASTSDSRAGQLLAGLSSLVINPSSEPVAVSNIGGTNSVQEVDAEAPNDDVETLNKEGSSSSEDAQFQLGGLDTRVTEGGALVGADATDAQSKEIINSLAETISSMTEQLGRKDKQIEVLEEQVAELKEFIKGGEVVSALEGEATEAVIDEQKLDAETSLELVETELESSIAESAAQASEEGTPKYLWLLAILAVVLALGVALRERLARLWESLNLTGKKDQLEFQSTVMEEPEREEYRSSVTEPVVKSSPEPEDDVVEFNTEEFSESFTEFGSSSIFIDESIPEEELDFEQRFARLIADGDLEFARQLLDIAHGHDVDDERYHFYRLQLFALRFDEDSFYEYYYSIENDIPQFNSVVQTDISKLVVQLAQN